MANKPEQTPFEILMQDIGLALLKFTNYDLGEVKVVESAKDDAVAEESEPKATKTRGRKPKVEAPVEPEAEDDGEDEESDELTEADLKKKTERQLRAIAIEIGYDKDDVKGADKETLIESILHADDEDEDEEESESEEEASDGNEALVAKLEGQTLTAVKKVAREEYGFKASDYKGMDKDALIGMILEKATDSDIEDDEDEEEGYTEDELNEMSMAELKAVCKEWGIKMKIGEKKQAHVDAILDAQEEAE